LDTVSGVSDVAVFTAVPVMRLCRCWLLKFTSASFVAGINTVVGFTGTLDAVFHPRC
jgi:hypothetical protein